MQDPERGRLYTIVIGTIVINQIKLFLQITPGVLPLERTTPKTQSDWTK